MRGSGQIRRGPELSVPLSQGKLNPKRFGKLDLGRCRNGACKMKRRIYKRSFSHKERWQWEERSAMKLGAMGIRTRAKQRQLLGGAESGGVSRPLLRMPSA